MCLTSICSNTVEYGLINTQLLGTLCLRFAAHPTAIINPCTQGHLQVLQPGAWFLASGQNSQLELYLLFLPMDT